MSIFQKCNSCLVWTDTLRPLAKVVVFGAVGEFDQLLWNIESLGIVIVRYLCIFIFINNIPIFIAGFMGALWYYTTFFLWQCSGYIIQLENKIMNKVMIYNGDEWYWSRFDNCICWLCHKLWQQEL